jgi:hypothetical protein
MYVRLVPGVIGRTLRARNDLLIESLAPRQQLAVYARRQIKPQLRNEDRIFWSVVVRIVGELRALGFTASARTVHGYRRELRCPPSQSQRTFLDNRTKDIWTVDLFTLQTVTLRTLYAIVFIGRDRRRIMHVNVTRHPTAEWVWLQLFEATLSGTQPQHLIRDRDLWDHKTRSDQAASRRAAFTAAR